MILKSMSRKGGILNVLEYIADPNKKGEQSLLWNLRATDTSLKEIEKEFLDNSRYTARRKRKNGIMIYHEVLSLSRFDLSEAKPEILLDLAEHYLEARAKNALAYALPHYDSGNAHIHIIISANERKSSKKLRISKYQFQRIKKELEDYQRRKYPQLSNSIVDHTKSLKQANDRKTPEVKEKIKETRQERERSRRFNKANQPKPPTKKEKLNEIITKSLFKATSEAHLAKILHKERVTYTHRGQNITTSFVGDKMKYRFSTLGLTDLYAQRKAQWEQSRKRDPEVQEIHAEKARRLWNEMGFKDDIETLLDPPQDSRSKELEEIKRNKRQYQRDHERDIFL